MKPWREVAVPHADVLKGTFQQSEFAAAVKRELPFSADLNRPMAIARGFPPGFQRFDRRKGYLNCST